jgi:hypothetical protein
MNGCGMYLMMKKMIFGWMKFKEMAKRRELKNYV